MFMLIACNDTPLEKDLSDDVREQAMEEIRPILVNTYTDIVITQSMIDMALEGKISDEIALKEYNKVWRYKLGYYDSLVKLSLDFNKKSEAYLEALIKRRQIKILRDKIDQINLMRVEEATKYNEQTSENGRN